MTPHRLYVGTIGEGLFRSDDHGQSFRRVCEGMFVECHVRALLIHPDDPATLYLGSELGVFVSRDGADTWHQCPVPFRDEQVWSLLILAPGTLMAGTRPGNIFRSLDDGASWHETTNCIERDCPRIMHTRVTCLTSDPENPGHVYAGVEIDGIHRSRDHGETWESIGAGLSSRDIHSLVIMPGNQGQRFLAATNNDLNASDDGKTWTPLRINESMPWSYCRALAQKSNDPNTIFLGSGDRPPGWEGAIGISRDGGRSWKQAKMPGRSNSTMWNFATHGTDPQLVYGASVSGQVYRSEDGGETWTKLAVEFGEIRALKWGPT